VETTPALSEETPPPITGTSAAAVPLEGPAVPIAGSLANRSFTIASGEKAKARDILAAIHTVKRIEQEQRLATDVERETLVRFAGFGAVALSIFPDPVSPVPWHTAWVYRNPRGIFCDTCASTSWQTNCVTPRSYSTTWHTWSKSGRTWSGRSPQRRTRQILPEWSSA
jgi:hypothetical protein